MRHVESPFMLNQWEQERNERKARMAERLAWLCYGTSAGLLLAFVIFQLAR